MPGGQTELFADTHLTPGAHTFELVSPSGAVLLTTTAITLTAKGVNQIVIYGSRDNLLYRFFSDSAADGAAVPAGRVLARFMNLHTDRQSPDVFSCPRTPATATFSAADCTPVKSGLAYGELWEQALPRDLKLLVGDVLLPIDLVCLADQSSDELTPSIVTYLMVANGYFRFDEFSAVGVCMSTW
jgi:hypothetical protein